MKSEVYWVTIAPHTLAHKVAHMETYTVAHMVALTVAHTIAQTAPNNLQPHNRSFGNVHL